MTLPRWTDTVWRLNRGGSSTLQVTTQNAQIGDLWFNRRELLAAAPYQADLAWWPQPAIMTQSDWCSRVRASWSPTRRGW